MEQVMKKSRSYDQYQLKELSYLVCDNIEDLFSVLNISSYKISGNMISMSCPIHGGDNDSALNLYHEGDSYRGNWKCRTHQCEQVFKSSIIGFIRGCLSREKLSWQKVEDDTVSFKEAIDFAIGFAKHDPIISKVSKKDKEKNNFVNMVKHTGAVPVSKCPTVSREMVVKGLTIPSKYFLDRGFTKNILEKYDIGDCIKTDREMSNRAVVPIYDISRSTMVGCTGRATDGQLPKWRHSKGLKTQEHLYNFWFAREHIKSSRCVIIVESPGNVWRLEESGIHNSVAIFGASLQDKQKLLLDISGAMNIITIMDNDKAGADAAKQIRDKCERTYNINNISLEHNDIADMSISEIKDTIKPMIERIK